MIKSRGRNVWGWFKNVNSILIYKDVLYDDLNSGDMLCVSRTLICCVRICFSLISCTNLFMCEISWQLHREWINALFFNGTNCKLWCNFFFLQSRACSLLCWLGCSVLLVRLCPQLFGLKPSETKSGSVTSQKEHDEVLWCELVIHGRSVSLKCIYHLNLFILLLKKVHSCW